MLSLNPFHGETRPSCGINVDTLIGHCFACGTSYNLTKLVAHCMGWTVNFKDRDGKNNEFYDYGKAEEWLEEKFNIDKREVSLNELGIIRIDDEEIPQKSERYETDKIKLAVFKSGKVVHDYFLKRGFTKDVAKKYLIGWDSKRLRLTIPVLWEDGVPCGVIGRAVLEMKINGKRNAEFFKVYRRDEFNDIKYYIYDNFPVGDIIYPLPFFKPIDDTAILVEGQFDAIHCQELGFTNVASTLGSKISYDKKTGRCKQIEILQKYGVRKVVLLRDDDKAGRAGAEHDYELLRKAGMIVYGINYPEGKSDPQELTKEELQSMLDNKFLFKLGTNKIKRIND